MIDIWMVFMMLYPFLIVCLYAAMELLKNRKNKVKTSNGDWIDKLDGKMMLISNLLDFVLPLLLTIFIILYWTVGLFHYITEDPGSVCWKLY